MFLSRSYFPMVDSIILSVYTDALSDIDMRIKPDRFNERTNSGNYKNLKVIQVGSIMTIIGSLPKYYHGTNKQTLSYHDMCCAFEKLAWELNFNLAHAEIYRLDLAATFKMDNSPGAYIDLFRNHGLTNYKGIYYEGKTLTFKNQTRSLKLYNKSVELAKKSPEHYETSDKNLLRYELTWLRALKKELRLTSALTVEQLMKPAMYIYVVKRWRNYFSTFPVINDTHSISKASDKKSMLEALASKALRENSLKAQVEDRFNLLAENKCISKRQKNRNKTYFRNLANQRPEDCFHPYYIELEQNVEEQYRQACRETAPLVA